MAIRLIEGEAARRASGNAFDQAAAKLAAMIPQDANQKWIEERTRVAVGPRIIVSGRLIFNEPVRIEGCFRGEVRSIDLVVISEDGRVEGKVYAPRLLVMGELRGDVTAAERVALGPRARVYGNIDTQRLTVCEGAHFDGRVSMTGLAELARAK
jgi:cytoskeletal protein CcmA (bactofilin family)